MPAKAAPAPGSLPLAAYFSTLAYLSLLLLSSLISLPRSTAWFYSMAGLELPTHNTSTDRPEPEFLRPFTASPIGTTAWVTLGTALVMLWWGGKIAGWFGSPQTFGMRARDTIIATLGTALLFVVLTTLLGTPAAYILETSLFSLHLAFLTAWPVVYTLGIPSLYEDGIAARYRMTRLVCAWRAEDAKERALAYPMAGALVGGWIGAIPLALDWDRPWQAWPLVPLLTSTLGFIVGGYYSWISSAYSALQQEVADEAAATKAAAAKPEPKKSRRKMK